MKKTISEETQIQNSQMVVVSDFIEDIGVDMKYSTKDNFTGHIIYNFSDAYLRYGTVKRLKEAQEIFKKKGYKLKIWDAYRPARAQFAMWEIYPVDGFVADPTKGYSNHTRGNAVDVTLTDFSGNEVEMPTGFDCFEEMSAYDYNAKENSEKTKNALFLKEVMESVGFYPCSTEWWHFNDIDKYPPEDDFVGASGE